MQELNITFFEKHSTKILFIGLTFIIMSPLLFTLPSLTSYYDFSKTGQIGDTIGGITAPIVNFLGAVLVYISFKSQQRANIQQWKAIKLDTRIRYFDNSFERIYSIHNELVKENTIRVYVAEIDNHIRRKDDGIQAFYKGYSKKRIKLDVFFNSYSNLVEKVKESEIDLELKENYFSELYLLALDHSDIFDSQEKFLSIFLGNIRNYSTTFNQLELEFRNTLKKVSKFNETFSFCKRVVHGEENE